MMKQQRIPTFFPYFFAVLITLLAFLLTLLVSPLMGTSNFSLIFFLAIAISAWYGGLFSGILSTFIAALGIEYFFFHTYTTIALQQLAPTIQIVLFLIEGYCISFFIDLGKRGNNMIAYRRREKEHIQRFLELEYNYIKAQEEIRSRDEFLSIASHELKTPLTSMLLQLQTALHNIRSVSLAQFSVEDLLKMLESAENKTKRLSKMINDLLNVSLITTSRMELEAEELDLVTLVNNVLEDFAEKLEKENYELKFEVNDPVMGFWDKVRMEQAISNLIANAIKYGNGKPITVSVLGHDAMAKVTIKDQGIGIPAKEQDRIFALFQRAVSRNNYKGLGVGLFITNQIIKAHGGKIAISSQEGKGSVFTIKLPLPK